MKRLRRLIPLRRRFFAWQLEVTTRCGLRCPSCFHREGDTQRLDLPWELLQGLEPHLTRVDNVILQGWGEPLLYPHLCGALEFAASRGVRAGFVTSGFGLDEALAREVVRAGTGFISFSVGGAREETHTLLRPGSSLAWVTDGVAQLRRATLNLGPPRLELELTFLLQRQNVRDLPDVVDLAGRIGADSVVAINPTYVGNREQEEQRLFVCGGEPDAEYVELFRDAAARAREKGVGLRLPHLRGEEVLVCEEDPLRCLFIASDGEVGPCVNMLPPVQAYRHLYCGNEVDGARQGFGNLADSDLLRIWDSRAYREFRRILNERRLVASKELPQREEFPDPPRPCQACHKMLGL
jgi:MoaA/NifB/PqqE/SkfB family radical SAM enzyme